MVWLERASWLDPTLSHSSSLSFPLKANNLHISRWWDCTPPKNSGTWGQGADSSYQSRCEPRIILKNYSYYCLSVFWKLLNIMEKKSTKNLHCSSKSGLLLSKFISLKKREILVHRIFDSTKNISVKLN